MHIGDFIFVYGTLRPGQYAGDFMRGLCKHVETTTLYGAKILSIGGRFPGLILTPESPDYFVIGDLFEVIEEPEVIAKKLDGYEGCPVLYHRQQVKIGDKLAWVYTFNNPMEQNYPVLTSGDWSKRNDSHTTELPMVDKAKFDPL